MWVVSKSNIKLLLESEKHIHLYFKSMMFFFKLFYMYILLDREEGTLKINSCPNFLSVTCTPTPENQQFAAGIVCN
jgi:uncharacterized membrane protein